MLRSRSWPKPSRRRHASRRSTVAAISAGTISSGAYSAAECRPLLGSWVRSGTNHWIRNTLRAATGSLLHDPFVRALNKQGVRVLSAYVRIPLNSPGHSALNSLPCSRVLAHPSEAASAADAKRQLIPRISPPFLASLRSLARVQRSSDAASTMGVDAGSERRRDSPRSSSRWAAWRSRSRMASATVGSPSPSCQ